ncbi:hypothetical protein J8273_8331 [Carpediemonas membranifera]|uniref:Uncharacterized protein n=1 Tax=Carpediemonas membranifera TaxID=201153 RepID=A0A8J6BUF3_9EUKA|nr:hypothetical protein J8273_8331 [Carpediemonas membranifera]|eukprot:KAG9390291.1 hypothetical protein J8273_8331 [Carpediemonas membranifera]
MTRHMIFTALKAKHSELVDQFDVLKESELLMHLQFAYELHKFDKMLHKHDPPMALPSHVGDGILDIVPVAIQILKDPAGTQEMLYTTCSSRLEDVFAAPRPESAVPRESATSTPAPGDRPESQEQREPELSEADEAQLGDVILGLVTDVATHFQLYRATWGSPTQGVPTTVRMPPPLRPVDLKELPALQKATLSTEIGDLVSAVAGSVLQNTTKDIARTIAELMGQSKPAE